MTGKSETLTNLISAALALSALILVLGGCTHVVRFELCQCSAEPQTIEEAIEQNDAYCVKASER